MGKRSMGVLGSGQLGLAFASGESTLSVRQFGVYEALSRPFEVSVIARSGNWGIDLESIVGKAASFTLASTALGDRFQSRTWHGVCASMDLLHAEPTGMSTYRLRIVPALWLLSQRRQSRIYQREKLPDIAKKLLESWGLSAELKLGRSYLPHDTVVQYEETDLDFFQRLLERAGITYFFDFKEAESNLVLTDAPHEGPARPGGPIRFADTPSEDAEVEFVTRVKLGHELRPGSFSLRDFDFRRRPDFDLVGRHEATEQGQDGTTSFLERYRYEQGAMLRVGPKDDATEATPAADRKAKVRASLEEGTRDARLRLEAERAGRRAVRFATSAGDLAPGVRFEMTGHPHPELAGRLLVTGFVIEGTEGERWTLAGEAVFTSEPWVPPRVTRAPRIHGVQSAMVVGAPNEEIHTEEHARVRVAFHWDRDGKRNDEASSWLRVSEAWAGAGFGHVVLPRVGQEVLVAFLGGDPEQPVVVGRVYNAASPVPYKLPRYKTCSGWKSASSPGGEGFNEIFFEDAAKKELFYVQAQRDGQKLTKREEVERIGHEHAIVVGRHRTAVVGTVEAAMVGGRATRQMIKPPSERDLHIAEQLAPEVQPTETALQLRDGRLILTTGKATVALSGGAIFLEAEGDVTLRADGGDVVLEGSRAILNTVSPPPAPRIDATQPPGAFKSNLALARELCDAAGSADASDVELVARELAKLPAHVLQRLKNQGTRVKVCRGSVTDHRTELKGVTPRGWPPGATWDQVPGLHSGPAKEVVIATVGHGTPAGAHVPTQGEGHGSQSIVIHETFHAVDLQTGGKPMNADPAFGAARDADAAALDPYQQQPGSAGLEETYAESAARYYGGDPSYATTHPNLHAYWGGDPLKPKP
jgi:type VI secretion system secreted protein VgrG